MPTFVMPELIKTAAFQEYEYGFGTDFKKTAPKTTDASIEINASVFSDFINVAPEEALRMADITAAITDFCTANTHHTPCDSFYSWTTTTTTRYTQLFDTVHELELCYTKVRKDSVGYDILTNTIIVTIPVVVLKAHRAYAVTPELMAWLSVPDRPRRAAIRAQLFYGA